MKVVQELLGHSDIAITLGLYSHLLPSMQKEVTDMWDGVFHRSEDERGYDRAMPRLLRPRIAQRDGAPHQRQKVSVSEDTRVVGRPCAHSTDPCHLA